MTLRFSNDMRNSEGTGEYRSPLDVLTSLHRSLATDRRDKIFFSVVIKTIVVATSCLDIICYGKSSAQLTLPSWFTDWVSKLPQTLVIERGGDDLYIATGSSFQGKASYRTLGFIEVVNNGLMLEAKCFQFDIIDKVGVAESVCQEDPHSLYQRLLQLETTTSPHGSEQGILQVIWVA